MFRFRLHRRHQRREFVLGDAFDDGVGDLWFTLSQGAGVVHDDGVDAC